jgi:hypothetical protein
LWTAKTTIKNNDLHSVATLRHALQQRMDGRDTAEDVAKMHYMSFDGDLRADIDE